MLVWYIIYLMQSNCNSLRTTMCMSKTKCNNKILYKKQEQKPKRKKKLLVQPTNAMLYLAFLLLLLLMHHVSIHSMPVFVSMDGAQKWKTRKKSKQNNADEKYLLKDISNVNFISFHSFLLALY